MAGVNAATGQAFSPAALAAALASTAVSGAATLNPGGIATLTAGSFTVTVTGAVLGTHIVRGWKFPTATLGGLQITAEVTTSNTVTVYYYNPTGSTITPTSGSFTVYLGTS